MLHQEVTIETLHDDALLAIFLSYLNQFRERESAWQMLVHVCRRWRHLVFAFPDYLNVRLRCNNKAKPVRETLSIWPVLPIAVSGIVIDIDDEDDIVVALEQRDRVREISLEAYPSFDSSGTVVPAMLVPIPALMRLFLMAGEVSAPVIPDTFLGGSAPHLQFLHLHGIPFPALPDLLLSARDLVDLTLSGIPRSGTFSPEAIVNSIADLSRLESLSLRFRSRQSCLVPGSRSPPVARDVLPALNRLCFEGTPEYLEDLISRIDTPLIHHLDMTFFNQPFLPSDFYHLGQFIGRTEKFKSLTQAYINFRTSQVLLSQRTQTYDAALSVATFCKGLHPQLWYLAQICSASLLPLSTAESLEVSSELLRWQLHQGHVEEDARWLNVLQPFSGVKNLYPQENTLPSLAYALKEVPEERVAEVLPALQVVSMDEPSPPGPLDLDMPLPPAVQEAIDWFIAMRRLSTTCVDSKYWMGD